MQKTELETGMRQNQTHAEICFQIKFILIFNKKNTEF